MSEIIAALCKAQAKFPEIQKDKENPHFRNRYASLDAMISATRPALTENSLVLTHEVRRQEGQFFVACILLHPTGRLENVVPIFFDPTMQSFGSAMTYARRYGDAGLLNIAADEDDDGNASQPNKAKRQTASKPDTKQEAKPDQKPAGKTYPTEQLHAKARASYAEAATKEELITKLEKIAGHRDLFETAEAFNEALEMVLDRIQELMEAGAMTQEVAMEVNKKKNLLIAKLPGVVTAEELEAQAKETFG